MGALTGFLVLSFLVFVHELGHFLAAKWRGVGVITFSIGFGKRIFGFKYGETDYRISLIPFGGYVAMKGENPDEDLSGGDDEFAGKTKTDRAIIAIAGPLFNYITAILLLWYVFVSGVMTMPQPKENIVGFVEDSSAAFISGILVGDTLLELNGTAINNWDTFVSDILLAPNIELNILRANANGRDELKITPKFFGKEKVGWSGIYKAQTVIIGKLVETGSAKKAGVMVEDTIISINNKLIGSWNLLVKEIADSKGNPLIFKIKRDTILEITVNPVLDESSKRYLVGIYPKRIKEKYSIVSALGMSFKKTAEDAKMIVTTIKALFKGRISPRNMAGPVGIIQGTGMMAELGFSVLLKFVAMISVNLALINLFPFLIITDGGILFFLLLEAIRGKKISRKKEVVIQQVAMVLLMSLALLVTFNDVLRIFTK